MLFSSTVFIFAFLPAVIIIYYALKISRTAQNVFLCIASLFFYAWGEPRFVFVMMFSIIVNWFFGLVVDIYRDSFFVRLWILLDIIINLSIIFVFKYLMFTLKNVNLLFGSHIDIPEIMLPIGISFFTFQAISYVIDVYRKKGKAQRNVLNVCLYISFFPQLIAGPIVRYETIAEQIQDRKESMDLFAEGVQRFILGLGKKVIIANNMALIADQAFGIDNGTLDWFGESVSLSPAMGWIGAIAYTLQIYYDFSGYSDMAIGLGKMFGFRFNENFNYPYISKSITEFWRRWHISLSSWFRDYVYIPLGGSRTGKTWKNYFNIFVVWLCTGIWHGANWTFIVWGLVYCLLLLIEKSTGFHKLNSSKWIDVIRHFYTMFFVILNWVVFRAENIGDAISFIGGMFSLNNGVFIDDPALFYLRQFWFFLMIAVLLSMPIIPKVSTWVNTHQKNVAIRVIYEIISLSVVLGILIVSVSYIVIGSYNPFIYFNF